MKFLAVFLFAFLIAVPSAWAQTSLDVAAGADVEVRSDNTSEDTTTPVESTDENSQERGPNENANANASLKVQGNVNAEAHRSDVASFVQSLRATADRDAGIGAEVSAVAQSQEESGRASADAMARIEKRSGVMNFLFGTDWKTTGSLRSEMRKSESDRARLEAALQNTTDASVRADLEAAIEKLDARHDEMESFVTEHENKFSLFGWFFRLFARAEA